MSKKIVELNFYESIYFSLNDLLIYILVLVNLKAFAYIHFSLKFYMSENNH